MQNPTDRAMTDIMDLPENEVAEYGEKLKSFSLATIDDVQSLAGFQNLLLEDLIQSRNSILELQDEISSFIDVTKQMASMSENPQIYSTVKELMSIKIQTSKALLDLFHKVAQIQKIQNPNSNQKAGTINNTQINVNPKDEKSSEEEVSAKAVTSDIIRQIQSEEK